MNSFLTFLKRIFDSRYNKSEPEKNEEHQGFFLKDTGHKKHNFTKNIILNRYLRWCYMLEKEGMSEKLKEEGVALLHELEYFRMEMAFNRGTDHLEVRMEWSDKFEEIKSNINTNITTFENLKSED